MTHLPFVKMILDSFFLHFLLPVSRYSLTILSKINYSNNSTKNREGNMGKKIKAQKILNVFSKVIKSDAAKMVIGIAKDAAEQLGITIVGQVLIAAINSNDYFTPEEKEAKITEVNSAIDNFDNLSKKEAIEFASTITDALFGDIDYEDGDVEEIKAKIVEIKDDIVHIMNGNALYFIELSNDLADLKEDLAEAIDVAKSYTDGSDKKPSAEDVPSEGVVDVAYELPAPAPSAIDTDLNDAIIPPAPPSSIDTADSSSTNTDEVAALGLDASHVTE